jgi:hypothetical protein
LWCGQWTGADAAWPTLDLDPSDLGARMTYLAESKTQGPDGDFALPIN